MLPLGPVSAKITKTSNDDTVTLQVYKYMFTVHSHYYWIHVLLLGVRKYFFKYTIALVLSLLCFIRS